MMTSRNNQQGHALGPAAARVAFGRAVSALLKTRRRSSNSLAGAVGVSAAYLRKVECGRASTPFTTACRIIKTLDPEHDLAGTMLWDAIVGAGLGSEERSYLRAVLPTLAQQECEALGGEPVILRRPELRAVAMKCQALADRVGRILGDDSDRADGMQMDTAKSCAQLVRLDVLLDAFPGPTRELRRTAARVWYRRLHRLERLRVGGGLGVPRQTRLPDGRTAGAAQRTLRQPRGRRGSPCSPEVWEAIVCGVFDQGQSFARAWRLTALPAARHKWHRPPLSTLETYFREFRRDLALDSRETE